MILNLKLIVGKEMRENFDLLSVLYEHTFTCVNKNGEPVNVIQSLLCNMCQKMELMIHCQFDKYRVK